MKRGRQGFESFIHLFIDSLVHWINDSMDQMDQSPNRRSFCALAGGAVASLALATACRRSWANLPSDGRFKARPRSNTGDPAAVTPSPLGSSSVGRQIYFGLDRDRDAILQLPKSATNAPLPLLLFLHGATQSAEDMFWYLDSAPDEAGVAILAPNARDTTWDVITDSFGPDVEFVNRALQRVFDTVAIDPARIAFGGFSDGATYAIALGLINGDLFKRILGCSPGFVIDGPTTGKPSFFISHGTRDNILPIDSCGRRVAVDLKARGYEVTFREFDGRHEIPRDVMLEGLRWVARA
jgi:predicted esterase